MRAETTWQHTWPGPLWVVAVLAAVALALIVWCYRREPPVTGAASRRTLVLLRVLVVGLVLWMLFGWMLQRHRTEPADLIVALDDSASMAFVHDQWDAAASARIRRLVPQRGENPPARFELARALLTHPRYGWLDALGQEYFVRVVLLSDSVREPDGAAPFDGLAAIAPDRPASRLGAGLRTLLEGQRGRPTAAIVLLSDGNTTDGPSLAEIAPLAREHAIPLYTVGIGSEQPARDLRLSELIADDIAFVDDSVTVACQLQATGLGGQATTVRLVRTDTGETLAERAVDIPAAVERLPVRLSFRAATAGQYPLRVSAAPLDGEADVENNHLSHHLQVYDSTIRVLLVWASPAYEFRNLRNLLARAVKPGGDGREKAFSLAAVLQEADRAWVEQEASALAAFPLQRDELFRYDVVILGDADPAFLGHAAATDLVDFVQEQGGGVAFVAGPRFMPLAYRGSPLAKLMPFDLATAAAPGDAPLDVPVPLQLTAIGQLMPPCQLASTPEDNARLWSQLPGVYWHLDLPDPSPAARVFVEHSSRSDASGRRLPLILSQYFGKGRVVFHATDETYRWARHEGRDEHYARYWLQTVRYLGRSKLLRDGSPAELSIDRQQYQYGEVVPIRVRFRQAGAAPQPPEPVMVVIERELAAPRQLALQPDAEDPSTFAGGASDLPPGSYRVWLASPSLSAPPAARSFEVSAPAHEQALRPLNAADLRGAADRSRGRYYTLKNADRLPGELPRGQRVRIESLPPQPIWNSPLAAALFVALLTAEWALRRRAGLL